MSSDSPGAGYGAVSSRTDASAAMVAYGPQKGAAVRIACPRSTKLRSVSASAPEPPGVATATPGLVRDGQCRCVSASRNAGSPAIGAYGAISMGVSSRHNAITLSCTTSLPWSSSSAPTVALITAAPVAARCWAALLSVKIRSSPESPWRESSR